MWQKSHVLLLTVSADGGVVARLVGGLVGEVGDLALLHVVDLCAGHGWCVARG